MSRKTVDNHLEQQQYNQDQLLAMIHRLMNERDVLWRENEYLKAKLNESVLMETINEMKRERDLLLKLLVNLTMKTNPYQDEPQPPIHPTFSSDENHNNGYSHDLLPPAPYQNFNGTPNGKTMLNTSPLIKKHPPRYHREQAMGTVEMKSARRMHRTKAHADHQQQQTPINQPAAVYRVEGTKECLMNPDELSSVFAHVKHSHPNKKIVVYKTSTTPQTPEFHQLVDEMCLKHGVELKHSQSSPFQQYRSQSLQDLTSPSTTNFVGHSQNFDYHFEPIEKQEPVRGSFAKK